MKCFRTAFIALSVALQLGFVAVSSAQDLFTRSLQNSDYDGDGVADLIGIKRPKNQGLQWYVTSSAANFASSISALSFGGLDALPIPGNWLSSQLSNLAVWEKDPNSEAVLWRVFTGLDVVSVAFGSVSDRVISGADFDGNGIHDVAVILPDGRVIVKTDLLAHTADSSVVSTEHTIPFLQRTTSRGVPIILRRAGDHDELGFLERRSVSGTPRYTLISRDIFGNLFEKNFGLVGRGISTGYALQNSSGRDSLLLISTEGSRRTFTLTDLDGGVLYRSSGKTKKATVIGNYLSAAGEEFAYFKKKKAIVVNPHLSIQSSFRVEDFEPVDSLSIRKLETGTSLGSGSGSDDKSDGPGLKSVCRSTRPFFSSTLWKPESDVGPPRGGKPIVLLRSGSKNGLSSLDIYASNGKKVCNFTLKQPSEPGVNGGADHYYSGWIGGCAKTGSEIANLARKASGNRKVYVQWRNGSCLGPVEPTAREGSL